MNSAETLVPQEPDSLCSPAQGRTSNEVSPSDRAWLEGVRPEVDCSGTGFEPAGRVLVPGRAS